MTRKFSVRDRDDANGEYVNADPSALLDSKRWITDSEREVLDFKR